MSDSDQKIPLFYSQKLIAKYEHNGNISSFLNQIIKHNEKVNLVSRETNLGGLVNLAAESLVPFEFFPIPTGKIFDIGPGGGFPSIIIMLAFPNLDGLLFERTGKKAHFLELIIKEFGLSALVIGDDFLQASRNIPKSDFDFGFMKYVSLDLKLLKGALKLLKNDGRFIYYSRLDSSLVKKDLHSSIESHAYYLNACEAVRTLVAFSPKR